jgi:hypothetical protein
MSSGAYPRGPQLPTGPAGLPTGPSRARLLSLLGAPARTGARPRSAAEAAQQPSRGAVQRCRAEVPCRGAVQRCRAEVPCRGAVHGVTAPSRCPRDALEMRTCHPPPPPTPAIHPPHPPRTRPGKSFFKKSKQPAAVDLTRKNVRESLRQVGH